jgi:OmpA-OmpF porin, OOP family
VTTKLLTALALALIAGAVHAQAPFPPPPAPTLIGPYIGGSFGYSQAKKGCLGVLSGGGRSCDANDPSFGLFAGYQVNRYLAAEIAYRDLGKVRATGPGSLETIHAMVFDFSALGVVPIEERFSAFGRLGGYYATLDTSVRGIADQSNSNLTYGGGLQWHFIKGYELRAEWQRYKRVGKQDNDFYGINYYDVLGISLLYRFPMRR